MDAGQSSEVHPSAGEDEAETVEIKIKTLDAQSYTLRVDKNTPVTALKDQIASVVGVPIENQRLICRGKVLKDDQLLDVEDGHTLHLVARQPPQPSTPSSTSGQEQAAGPTGPSDMVMVSPRNRAGHVSHSLLMGTINIPDSGEGGIPDLNRIISAVLNSVGMGNAIPAAAGTGPGGSVAVGAPPQRTQQVPGSDGQPQAEGADVRSPGAPPLGEQNDSIDDIEAQLQLDAIYGVPSPGIFAGTGAALPSNAFRILQQPAVVPDALTTMSQYMDRLEQSFSIIEGGRSHNVAAGSTASEVAQQVEGNAGVGQTSESLPGQTMDGAASSSAGPPRPPSNPTRSGGQGSGLPPAGPVAAPRRLPTPPSLGAVVSRAQHLLREQAGTALARLAAQLENEPNMVDAAAREEMQRTALRDGNMMQQLGALLLELGRTTLTLRMGQSPAESVVNAGPAVFISPSGPNPMMVQQSLPLQTGLALGALPPGTPQANGGNIVGPSLAPRSINIHIHTSDLRLPSPSPSATPAPQQPPSRAVIGVTSGPPVLTVRNLIEQADGTNNPEQALTVRQIIERAEAASGVQQGNAEANSQATAGVGAVQGAIMTFNENGAMRVVPVRTRTAAVPIATHPHTTGVEADALFQPLVARIQQQLASAQHGRPGSIPQGNNTAASTNVGGPTSSGEHPPTAGHSPSVRAQVHIQAWAPSVLQALGGLPPQPGSSQPVSGGAPVGETGLPVPAGQGHVVGSNGIQRDPNVPISNDRATDGAGTGQLQEGMVQGVDVTQIVDSLGPFLNQLAVVFQQARPQPPNQPPSQQVNEQRPLVSQPHVEGNAADAVVVATASPESTPESNGVSTQDGGDPIAVPAEQSDPVSEDKMDVVEKVENGEGSQDGTGNSSTSALPANEQAVDGKRPHEEEGQRRGEDRPLSPPIGLGLGGLQPLPARSRRRSQAARQVQMADTGAAAAAGNGLPAPPGREQTLVPVAGQNLQQSLVSSMDRPSNRPEGSSMEQLTQGLLPLLGSLGNRGSAQGGEGNRELGDFMGQLISRTAGGSGGQGAFPADMLTGMMGQLVQSPVMENLVQQVMTGVQNDETQNAGLSNRSPGGPGGFDFAGIVQQMLPVMSQMFGDRPASNAAQQVPSSTNIRNLNDGGAARDSPGQINDSGRWRESLSEEEITSWSETIAADVEQQQSMEPQRPFSDVYVRGSPLAKRQKVVQTPSDL